MFDHKNTTNHSTIVSVIKGCLNASEALILWLGSNLRHLLKKSINTLLSLLILDLILVILGV